MSFCIVLAEGLENSGLSHPFKVAVHIPSYDANKVNFNADGMIFRRLTQPVKKADQTAAPPVGWTGLSHYVYFHTASTPFHFRCDISEAQTQTGVELKTGDIMGFGQIFDSQEKPGPKAPANYNLYYLKPSATPYPSGTNKYTLKYVVTDGAKPAWP